MSNKMLLKFRGFGKRKVHESEPINLKKKAKSIRVPSDRHQENEYLKGIITGRLSPSDVAIY